MIDGSIDLMKYFVHRFMKPGMKVLDIGGGSFSSLEFNKHGMEITIVDIKKANHRRDDVEYIQSDFYKWVPDRKYDAIWCSHVIEHVKNVGLFLEKMLESVRENSPIALLVPPYKNNLVGGHINLFTPASLCYNVVLSGQNLSKATVIKHGYNTALFWKKNAYPLPDLKYDKGDVETLSSMFPRPVFQSIDGEKNWDRIRSEFFDDLLNEHF